MEMKIVIFDVDGTLITGNCTYIFLNYLFDNHIIEPDEFTTFNNVFNRIHKTGLPYEELIVESARIMSRLKTSQLKAHWKKCFNERVKKQFHQNIVNQLKAYQEKNLEIALASGSHIELISLFGQELGIKPENIIATKSGRLNPGHLPGNSESICYGAVKEKRIIDFLVSKKSDLNQAIFYTDNISDLKLLSNIGKGYWAGSHEDWLDYSMAVKGIEFFNATISNNDSSEIQKENLIESLQDYYDRHALIIEQSITKIIPEKCTPETMEHLVGPIEYKWDFTALQQSFFDPVYKYIDEKKEEMIGLGSCIFMEAGEIDLEKHIALIGIGELLETSAEIFLDIKEWSDEKNIHLWNKSRIDHAITGNASIALISLVTNNLIFNRLPVNEKQKLLLYDGLTSVIFYSLLGNGLKLYWEQQPGITITEEEYFKVAFYTNRSKLEIPCNYWQILRAQNLSHKKSERLKLFIEYMSVAIQIKNDVISYELWKNNLPQPRTNKFQLNSNFLGIHAANHFDNPHVFTNSFTTEGIMETIIKSNSISYALSKSEEYKCKAFIHLNEFPMKKKYKKLIEAYAVTLMGR